MARVVERPHVLVAGSGEVGPELVELAVAVGAELARRGAVVVCGGLGGVMEGACRGAREAGGATLAILPGSDRRAANRYVDVSVSTGMGELRNGLLVHTIDAMIAIGAGYGTLSEVALALKAGKRVVGLGTWELACGGVSDDAVAQASDARDAVERALAPS